MKSNKRLIIYKVLIILFVAVILILPETMSQIPEIDMRVLVTVIGIDESDKGVKTSAQVIIPMMAGEGQIIQEVVEAEGATLSEALDKLNITMGRKVELGHCGMVVLGNKISEVGVEKYLKFLLSSGKISAGCSLVTSDTEASKFIDNANKLSEASSSGINNFITYSNSGAHIATVSLLGFLSESNSITETSSIPFVEIKEKPEENSSGSAGESESGKGGGAGGGSEKSKPTEIKNVESLMVFKNGKSVKKISKEETRGFTWIDNDSDKGLVFIEDFKVGEHHAGPISTNLKKKRVNSSIRIKDGIPVVTFKLDVYLQINDRHSLSELWKENNLDENQLNAALNEAFNEKIRGEIQQAIDVSKEINCDIFGFATKLKKFHFKDFKKYIDNGGDVLKNIQVEYKIKTRIY